MWSAIVVGGLLVVLLIIAALLDANADSLRGPIGRRASARLGREVRIDGRLQLHLLSWTPSVVVNQLRIANPDWVHHSKDTGSKDMARIGRLQVSLSIPALLEGEVLLPYVGIDDTDLDVERDAKQRLNWSFGSSGPAKPSATPTRLPILGSLHLGRGHLTVSDQVRKLRFNGTVTADQAANGGALSLSLNGDGAINGEPFKLTASGDPLITAENHKPYTVVSDIRAGRTKVKSRITITKPFDMGSVVADIEASGDDLADLYYLSGLALPNTAPYTVSSHLQREGSRLQLTNFKGSLGKSDIHGTMSIETATERPLLTADLYTRMLDITDLGPTLGSRLRRRSEPSSLSKQAAKHSGESAEESTAKARAAAGNTLHLHGAAPKSAQTRTAEANAADEKAAKGETLLPDAKHDLQRIRAMDANVKYHAEAVKTEKMSIRAILHRSEAQQRRHDLHAGVLRVAPGEADFQHHGGRLEGYPRGHAGFASERSA